MLIVVIGGTRYDHSADGLLTYRQVDMAAKISILGRTYVIFSKLSKIMLVYAIVDVSSKAFFTTTATVHFSPMCAGTMVYRFTLDRVDHGEDKVEDEEGKARGVLDFCSLGPAPQT